jgi:hypothetical protein
LNYTVVINVVQEILDAVLDFVQNTNCPGLAIPPTTGVLFFRGKKMAQYYVNTQAQATGEHEVHKDGCPHPPDVKNRLNLGDFSSCEQAVRAARTHYSNVDGCYHCSNACHKR